MQTCDQGDLKKQIATRALQELITEVEGGQPLRPAPSSRRGKISKGRPYGRVLHTEVLRDRRGVAKERYCHATKGWREIRRVL